MRGEKGPSGSVEINAPRDLVFGYVQDITRHHEWGTDEVRIEGPEGPAHEGFLYQAVATQRGRRNESAVFVTEVRPPERLEFEAEESTGLFGHEFTFEGTNGTTHVTHTIYTIVKPAKLLSVFSRGTVNKNVSAALHKLKENVEAVREQRWI